MRTILHNDPKIIIYDDLLTKDECRHLINVGRPLLQDSVVSDDKGGYISQGRTSKTAWFDHNHDVIIESIANRVSEIANIPLKNAEKFQLVYYDVSNEYRAHYDSWDHNGSDKTLRCVKYGGPRLLTALLYLNDVSAGGATRFTKLDINVQPKPGRLLTFENTLRDSIDKHPLSEHAGLPVTAGEKYICNLWFRQCDRSKLYRDIHPEYYNTDAFYLEIGDYFPFVTIQFADNTAKMIHNYVNSNDFIIVHCKDVNKLQNITLLPKFNYIVLYREGVPASKIISLSSKDAKIYNMFKESENINIYFLTSNRKIYRRTELQMIEDFSELKLEPRCISPAHVPFLMIEDVFTPELLDKVNDFYNNNSHRVTTHDNAGKNRHHLHPDNELEKIIDNKLSRSVFPEIMKIYYFDVKYREKYKICNYNSETGGRFHPHRDTPEPYRHRRYAMSLFLNDDYEGGEFELPEYNFKIKPKANCALIFPGISSHKINEVTKGMRKVIITFFCSEIEGKTKNNPLYSVKSDFYKDKKIEYSDIYPF